MSETPRRPPPFFRDEKKVTTALSKETPDTIFYKGVEYLLFESEPSPVFNLEQVGITTKKPSGPCFSGLVQVFAIRDGGLFLASLEEVEPPGTGLRLHYTGTLVSAKTGITPATLTCLEP